MKPKVRPLFGLHDALWGIYWNADKLRLHLFPLPFLGLVIDFGAGIACPGCTQRATDTGAHICPGFVNLNGTLSVPAAQEVKK